MASQAPPQPPLLPAVRAVSEELEAGVFEEAKKAPMASAFPKSPVLQGFSRMSYSKKEELNE